MSTRRPDPDHHCRFAFADGRHCRMPAHPSFDGLCYTHGTLAPRASRQDNFLRELAPLSGASPSAADYRHAHSAIARAVFYRRISPERAAALLQLSNALRHSQRLSQDESVQSGCGPAWDTLRQLLDNPSLDSTPDS